MLQSITQLFTNFGQAACDLPNRVYGVPTWYGYLPGQSDPYSGKCQVVMDFSIDTAKQITAIGLSAIEILLFVAGLVTVGFIIYGGFQYMTSMGDSDRTRTAKDTILNALIGLVIAISASALISFLATRLT